MFDKMKALFDMQKKMQEIKGQLEKSVFEIESSDGMVKIAMNGSQEVNQVSIRPDLKAIEKENLERALRDCYNRAIKRSHDIAADKLKSVTGLNLPGMV